MKRTTKSKSTRTLAKASKAKEPNRESITTHIIANAFGDRFDVCQWWASHRGKGNGVSAKRVTITVEHGDCADFTIQDITLTDSNNIRALADALADAADWLDGVDGTDDEDNHKFRD